MHVAECVCQSSLVGEGRVRCSVEFGFINISYTVVISDNVC